MMERLGMCSQVEVCLRIPSFHVNERLGASRRCGLPSINFHRRLAPSRSNKDLKSPCR